MYMYIYICIYIYIPPLYDDKLCRSTVERLTVLHYLASYCMYVLTVGR